MNEGITATLARFAAGLEAEDIPGAVTAKMRQLMLDCLGNQLAAHGEPQVKLLSDALDVTSTSGPATVVGGGARTSAVLAGCMNAMQAHLLDMDDAHRDALTKTGSAVTPAVMAVGEAVDANGAQALHAAVAGYEVMIRLGLALNPGHRARGFHSTATLGVFGAAVAAGCLLGLDEARMIDALGIAGTQSAGLTAFIENESMTKPFNVAKAVHGGILAARLASQGFRGPPDVLEGREGHFRAYAGTADLEALLDGLGTRYRLLESGFKPHAACRYAHAPIDAAVELVHRHRVAASDIAGIDVHLSQLADRQSNFHDPTSVASAQGSTPFVVAASVVLKTTSLSVADVKRAFGDATVRELHRRVQLRVDTNMPYMGRGARVAVRLADGRELVHAIALPRGEPENPMSDGEIADKYARAAEPTLGRAQALALRERMTRLDEAHRVRDIMRLCVAPANGVRAA